MQMINNEDIMMAMINFKEASKHESLAPRNSDSVMFHVWYSLLLQPGCGT